MQDLVEIYFNGGDYHMTRLMALKILEEKNDADVRALLGYSYLKMGEEQIAFENFLQALKADKRKKKGISAKYQLFWRKIPHGVSRCAVKLQQCKAAKL